MLLKEVEKKIIVNKNIFHRYLNDLGDAKRSVQIDTYFDTDSFEFARKGESVRIRDVISKGISKITFKCPVGSESGLFIREENEIHLPPQTKQDTDALMEVFKRLGVKTDTEILDRKKTEEVLKRIYNIIGTVEKNGYRFLKDDIKIALDVTIFRTQTGEKTVHIIEIEGTKEQIEIEYNRFIDRYGNMGNIDVSKKNNYQMLLSDVSS